MKTLPRSIPGRIRLVTLLILLLLVAAHFRIDRVAAYALSGKQEGDILFQSLPRGELVDAIEGVTGSEWSHCGILLRRHNRWVVAEALGQVSYTPLALWVVRGREARVGVYRNPELSRNALSIQTGVDRLLGRPYDFNYAPDDEEIYCSELIQKVLARELGMEIGQWERLGDLNWRPHESFIRSMENGRLPLDRLMVTPVSLTRDPQLVRVF